MRLIPYNKFIIKSSCTPDEINSKLNGVTTIGSQTLYPKAVLTPFIGHMDGRGFKIALSGYDPIDAVYKRNSFSPQIIGRYNVSVEGTEIIITQRVALPVAIVMSIWTLGVVFTLLMLVLLLLQGEPFDMGFLIPLIMLGIMLKVVGVGFWHGADNSKEIILRILY